MNTVQTRKKCPYCPLFVEEELHDPIENEFFGEPAVIGTERSCAGCAVVAEGQEEEVVADLYRWRASHGGTELNSFFGSIAWVADYALERLAEYMGSTVEMVTFVGEVREQVEGERMVIVSNYAQDGFVVDIGPYSIWVEEMHGFRLTGTTVVNRDEYPLAKQEAAG